MIRRWVLDLQVIAWGLFFVGLGIAGMQEEVYKRVLFAVFGGVLALVGLCSLLHPSRSEMVFGPQEAQGFLQVGVFAILLGFGGAVYIWVTWNQQGLEWLYIAFCFLVGLEGIGLVVVATRKR